jgi:hypothetical protein
VPGSARESQAVIVTTSPSIRKTKVSLATPFTPQDHHPGAQGSFYPRGLLPGDDFHHMATRTTPASSVDT